MRTAYQGRALFVDLTNRTTWVHMLEDEYLTKYLGGRGAAAKMLWDMTSPKTKPLGPKNPLIISPGVLTGTSAPTTGRTSVTFKSPATGGYFKTNVGGGLGLALKHAGFDHIVIRGRSKSPVYLYVGVDGAEIRDASELWGQDVKVTNRRIKEELENEEIRVACIGRAGENLSAYAAIMSTYYNAAARGGGGAVMGAKKLKAIAVNPDRGRMYVAQPERFAAIAQRSRETSLADSHSRTMKWGGTASTLDQLSDARLLPTYNFKGQYLESGAERLNGKVLLEGSYLKRSVSCSTCIFGCHRYTVVPEGKYEGTYSEGPEYETFAALGANLGITDTDTVLKANEMANNYGYDTISLGGVISWAIESYERGVLTATDFEGFEPKWEDPETLLYMIDLIVEQRGIGELLSRGIHTAAKEIGKDSYKWAIEARGLEMSRVELRGVFSYALAFALNPRGPDHLMTECLAEFGAGFTKQAVKTIKKITGDEEYAYPYLYEKRPEIVSWHEDIYAATDCLGYCAFATTAAYGIDEGIMAETLSAATGIEISADALMEAGRRIVTLERCYNIREGWSRSMDVLPWRIMHEVADDLQPQQPTPAIWLPETLDRMLDEYYDLQGWDKGDGFPTPETLNRLGLGYTTHALSELRELASSRESGELSVSTE